MLCNCSELVGDSSTVALQSVDARPEDGTRPDCTPTRASSAPTRRSKTVMSTNTDSTYGVGTRENYTN